MKKFLALFLSLVLTLSLTTAVCGAVSITEGGDMLNRSFLNGEYSNGGYDYVHFSPVKSENDSTKYPLLVWLHGMRSGTFPRAQLQWYSFCNFASEEYQSRFVNAGGCFLLAPRVGSGAVNSWDASKCGVLKSIIDEYISLYKDNIDTSRIYIAGYSTGGSMVWDMLTSYPDFFAAGAPLAAITQPGLISLNKLSDTSVWIFVSDNDPYLINDTENVMPTFNRLCEKTKRTDGIRLTRFSDVRFADYSKKTEGGVLASDAEHYVWEAFTHDMFMKDGVTPYVYATTLGQNGEISLNTPGVAVIDWLSRQTNEKTESSSPDGELSLFARLLQTLRRFIDRIRELLLNN